MSDDRDKESKVRKKAINKKTPKLKQVSKMMCFCTYREGEWNPDFKSLRDDTELWNQQIWLSSS